MVEHHRLNEYEFQQTAGGSEEQEAWHSAVHGVSKSLTRLSDGTTKTSTVCPW